MTDLPSENPSEAPSDTSSDDRVDAPPAAAAANGVPEVTVVFTVPADAHATSASVVGDFNDWDPAHGVMDLDESGSLSCSLSIAPGRTYQYRFLLDGDRWTNDWSAQAYAPNSFGGEDSVLDLTETVTGEHGS